MTPPRPPYRRIARAARALWRCRSGGTAMEYGLILALVVIVMVVAFSEMARVTVGIWSNVSTKVVTSSTNAG